MHEGSKLKAHLIDHGRVTPEDFFQAEDYALTRHIPVESSLLFLNLLDYEGLGRALAELHGRPYRSLLHEPPPDSAKSRVPLKFAARWHIFPVAYEPEDRCLTLASAEPSNATFLGRTKTLFPPSLKLEWTTASLQEIEKAIDVYYKGKALKQPAVLDIPEDFTILAPAQPPEEDSPTGPASSDKRVLLLDPDISRAGAVRTLLKGEGYQRVQWISSPKEMPRTLKENAFDLLVINGRTFPPLGSWWDMLPEDVEAPPTSYYDPSTLVSGQNFPYPQMSEALIQLASSFVRTPPALEPDLIDEILMRVRYCKLLALRLELLPTQVDGTVLAAWLSFPKIGKTFVKQLLAPYHLQDILFPPEDNGRPMRVEAAILKLIRYFQMLKKKNPALTKDMDRLRRLLIKQLPSSGMEKYLEIFLTLLKDEEFLENIDQPFGRILVVDETLSGSSHVIMRLNNDGFDVEVVSRAREVSGKLAEHYYDLVMSELHPADTDGLTFCRTLRSNPSTADIPFLFFTSQRGERLAAECLEAGADDFIQKPGNPEVLSLKIQRLLAARSHGEARQGVRGSLNEMNSCDFIQSLSAADKSVKITIERRNETGSIYLKNGEIVHAHTGEVKGEAAFCRIVAWEEGRLSLIHI